MLVAQVSDGQLQLGGLFDGFKVDVDKYRDIIDEFKNLNLSRAMFLNKDGTKNWGAISDAIGDCDERALSYFQSLDNGNGIIDNQSASTEGLSKYLKETGQLFDFTAIKATLLNTALNAGIGLIASFAIGSVIKGLDRSINRVKYAQEAMEEAQKAIDESQNKLKSANKVISENKKRFLELSQGVDKFSKNKFLSDEDYAEFLSISQQLADISPDLVYNYDEQGNALLRLGKNVKETSKMLDEMLDVQKATADKTLVDNLDDVANGVFESVKQAEKEIENLQFQLNSDGKIGKNTAYTDIDILKTLKDTGVFTFDDEGYRDYGKKFEEALTNAGISYSVDTNVNRKFLMLEDNDRLTLENVQKAQKYYNDMVEIQKKGLTAEEAGLKKNITEKERLIDDYYSKMSANLGAWVKEGYLYQSLDETNKAFVDNIIPTLDWDAINKDKFDSKGLSSYDYQSYIKENILEPLTTLPDEYKDEVTKGLSRLLEFKDGDLGIVSFGEELQKFLNEKNIKIDITPIFSDEKEAYNKLQNSIKDIAGKSQNELSTLKSFTKNFTEEEANRWEKVTLGADSAIEAIVKYKATLQDDYSSSIKELESSISSLTDTEELLNTALSEQAEKGTISQDTLVSLRDKYSNLSKVLEITANGVIINKDKLSELNAEEKKSVDKDLASTREKLVNQYNANSLAIAGYNMQLEDTNSMTDKQKSALEALLAVKENDQKQTSEQIAQLDLLGVEYDTLTSKTNKFLQSLSTADDGNIYDSVQSALEQVKEVYDEGDYGKDEFRNFVDYMSSEDMSTSSIDEIKSHYTEAMKTAERYFTENNKGVKNFVNDLKKLKMASQDANGSWTLNIGDIDEASKKLGISSDAMTDILNKLKDKGWKIDFTTADDDLVDVNAELNRLETKLEKLTKKKVKLKADGKSTEEIDQKISTVEKSIEGIKSEIQLSIDTEEAKTKILEYQSMIDELNTFSSVAGFLSGNAPKNNAADLQKKQKELADKYNLDLTALLSVDTSKADEKIEDTKEKSEKETTFEVDADTKKAVQKINAIFKKTYNLDVNIKVRNSRNKVSNFLNGLESSEDKGDSKANGTALIGKAYVNGKRGRISAGYSAKSLVGELAPEMRVRDGQYEILGLNGAEFTDVRPDDIIFNGEQTKEILKNGKINSRGNAYNTGANGSGGAFESHTTSKKKKEEEEKKKKKDKSSDVTKFQQAIDWCAQSINRLTSLIENVNAKINLTSNSLNKQLKYYNELINKQQKLIKGYEKSETAYQKAYNNALNKLSEKDRKKVENGTYTIENFKGKAKSGKTSEAEKRYNNIQSALEARDTYFKSQTDLVNAKQQLSEYIETLAGIRWEKANESIEKLNKNIEVLDAKSSNLNGYKSKNANLDAKVKTQYKTVKKQQNAVNKTQADKDTIDKKALNTKSKIDSKYKTSKRTNANGTLSEKNVTGKQLTLIKQYNLQIKKSNAYKKKLSEINKELEISEQEYITLMNESVVEKANNIQKDYENKLSLIDAKENRLNSQITLAEAKGQIASAKYYELLNQNSKQRICELEDEKKALETQQNVLGKNSDAWYEIEKAIISVDEQLAKETQNAVENISKQIEAVSDLTDAINKNLDLHTSSDFYASLTDGKDYYNENGMTDVGKSVLAAKYLEYTGKRQQRENLDEEGEEIHGKYIRGEITEAKRIQLTDEWLKKVQEADKEIIRLENAIGDMLTESYKAQLNRLKEIIDAKKKSLSLDKSEYDYQKSIAEKTKNIATLQKQLAMLEGRNDEEANAERQKIQLQLDDARENLEDTQYDKYIERVENALDDLSERFSDAIDELSKTLNNVEAIESNMHDLLSDNRGSIYEAVKNVFDEKGIDLSDTGDWLKYMQSLTVTEDKPATDEDQLQKQTDWLKKIYEKIPSDEEEKESAETMEHVTDKPEQETSKENVSLSVADVLGEISEENKKVDTSGMSALNKYLVSQGYNKMSTSNMADLASALRSSSSFDKLDKKTKETISSISNANQLNGAKDINANTNKNALLKALKFTRVQEFLDSHLKQGKENNNYGPVNKYLYKTYGKALTSTDAFMLGQMLGVSDANKNGKMDGKEGEKLVEKLKQAGFSQGGIVEAVHKNGDDGLATLKKGESVLTPSQTDVIKQFAGKFDETKFREFAQSMDLVTPALDNLREMQLKSMQLPTPDIKSTSTTSVGDIHMTFELPNVIDPQSFIKTIQNNPQVQKTLQNVTVGQLNGNMKFRGNRL